MEVICIKYASMQVYKYASMQVCKHASMQVCKYASIQACEYASVQVFRGNFGETKGELVCNPAHPVYL